MKFNIHLTLVLIFLSACSTKQNVVSNSCAEGRTILDGVCVREEVADYVSCVRAQGAQLKGVNSQSLSADVGYFAVNASIARDVSEKLEKKYNTSDKAMMTIIEQCNRLAGISSPVTKPETKPLKTTVQNIGGAKSCLDIKERNPKAKDGIYKIDVDGSSSLQPIDVYCNMSQEGGGWTLIAHHADGISRIKPVNLVNTSTYGVIKTPELWSAISKNMTTGMMFVDEHGKISMLSAASLNNGNCDSVSNHKDLSRPIQTVGGIWHNENSGCNGKGGDYSLVQLQDSRYKNYNIAGASLYQFSSAKFDKWPYPSDYSYKNQNRLFYYIK